MATIIAKTKKFIDDAHAEIEKVIPTELIVQENKLFLGHDGEVLAGQEGQPLLQGPKGDKGDTGATGPQGPQGATGPQGPKGDTGATPNITATASVNNAVGTPAVSVVKGGTAEAPTFAFNFTNLKGQTGAQGPAGEDGATGPQGPQGPVGPTPVITATASVDANTGTPSVEVVKGGTTANPTFAFNFKNLKGAKGDKGDAGAGGGVELYEFHLDLDRLTYGGSSGGIITLSCDFVLPSNYSNSKGTSFPPAGRFSTLESLQAFLSDIVYLVEKDQPASIIPSVVASGYLKSGSVLNVITDFMIDPNGTGINIRFIDSASMQLRVYSSPLPFEQITLGGTSLFAIRKILGTTATLATITADDETGDITITTPNNE